MGQICVSWHFLRKVPRVKLPVYKASGQKPFRFFDLNGFNQIRKSILKP
ncbi:hypothetical protein VCHA37P203_210046 [Vibrio chagasii]|nr:hypothetical protein VCHA37P203_210046 [Vibrio chagasii]